MSLLPDFQIERAMERGDIRVFPSLPELLQPASLDIRLGREIIEYVRLSEPIDPEVPRPEDITGYVVDIGKPFYLEPGQFVLGCTLETITLGRNIAARIEGKSTLARLGLIVHSTAGFVDPGFSGQLTLEMTNLNHRRIIIRPGMRIAQLSFNLLEPVHRPYGDKGLGSHYQGQQGATRAAKLLD